MSFPSFGISPVQNVPSVGASSPISPPGSSGSKGSGFGQVIEQLVNGSNQVMKTADQAVGQLASGETDDFQNVVMSMAKADLSFRFILEIRNKLMDAYQEIMRMQV